MATYRDAPETQEIHAEGDRIMDVFIQEALPAASDAIRKFVGELIMTSMTAGGKEFSETPRDDAEIEAYAAAMADMLFTYFSKLGQ